MGFIQTFIGLFRSKPQAVNEPEAQFIEKFGSSGGGGAKWLDGLSQSGRSTYINHREARRNARNAMQDSCQARAIVERFADTVADTGLRLEMSPNIKVLGISQDEAETWASDVESRFDLWAKDKRQHRSESLTFYQAQRLYQIFQHRDNDIFTRLYYDNDPILQNPLQFEFIDPDQIRGDALTTMWSLNSLGGASSTAGFQTVANDGIKRDSRGREIEYRIYMRQEDGTYDSADLPAKVGNRKLMLHGYRPEYAGQGRGYSRLAHAIQEFENITDFSASTIKKAINQSQFVGFVEPSKDEDAVNPFDGILTDQGAGPAASSVFGVTPTAAPAGATVDNIGPGLEAYYRVPEATMSNPGSMFIGNLTKGSTLKTFPNSAPGDSFDTFVDAFAGHLASSLSIPLEVVLMKFSNNYSASRATLVLFWRVANGWACEMDDDWMSPIVEMWLSGEIAAGRVVAPGWSDPRMRAAWLCKTWIGSPMPDIDPAKSAKARRDNIEMCVTNLDRESRDLNGTSAATNIAKNKALYKGFQLAPWVDNPTPAQAVTPAATGMIRRMGQLISDMEDLHETN